MVDKDLIAMCDCPEIQDKWEPKVGDKCWDSADKNDVMITDIQAAGVDDIALYLNDGGGYYEHSMTDNLTYIPRIEDVLEWLSDRMTQGKVMYEIIRRDEDSCLRGGIRCFMHFVHNKSWSGNAWI